MTFAIRPPNWKFWLTLPTGTLREALLLSLDLDPYDVEYADVFDSSDHDPALTPKVDHQEPILGEHGVEYERRRALALRGFNLAADGEDISLVEFVAKATDWGWLLPPELIAPPEWTSAVPSAPLATSAKRAQEAAPINGAADTGCTGNTTTPAPALASVAPVGLLPDTEVAKRVGRSRSWVNREAKAGRFPAKVQKGRWRSDEVEAWIKAQKL